MHRVKRKEEKVKGKLSFPSLTTGHQKNSELPSSTVGFFSLFSTTVNLHIRKTLTFTYQSIDRSKCKIHLRYTLRQEIFVA